MRRLGLAYLTSNPLSAPDVVRLAAKLGYQDIGLRLLPATPDGPVHGLIGHPERLRDVLTLMKNEGISVFDIEIVRITPEFDIRRYDAFFPVCAELGAKAILVAGDDADEGRLIANFAAFCQAAAPFGLTADLEYMPWTTTHNACTALRIVEHADQPNAGILIDALHTARSDTSIADIAAIPRKYLHYAQICDAPGGIPTTLEGLLHTARIERLLPGHGDIDLVSLFAALPADLPIAIEVPNEPQKHIMGVEEWARRCLEASKTVLANADAAHP